MPEAFTEMYWMLTASPALPFCDFVEDTQLVAMLSCRIGHLGLFSISVMSVNHSGPGTSVLSFIATGVKLIGWFIRATL